MQLQSFSAGATTIESGRQITATIRLVSAAQTARRVLLSTNDSALKIQKHADVPAGQTSVNVVMRATTLETGKVYIVHAQLEEISIKLQLTAVASRLATITFTPQDVPSGGSTTMSITLDNPAGQGGAFVALSESNSIVGNQLALPTLPVSVEILEGETSASLVLSVARMYNDEATKIQATFAGHTVEQWLYIKGENAVR